MERSSSEETGEEVMKKMVVHKLMLNRPLFRDIICTLYWMAFVLAVLSSSVQAGAEQEISDSILNAKESLGDIVFAVRKPPSNVHWYNNFGYYSDFELPEDPGITKHFHHNKRVAYRFGGKLCMLNARTGEVTTLLDDPRGTVRDPVIHYDGRTILFSYRRGDSENYHLYKMNADGTGLSQLTFGAYDDIEPCWLPDDRIMFISSRAKRWVPCWVTQVAVLFRCNADGSQIQQISANVEHDNTPWPLADGRIVYQRWEYVDRSQVDYHHLWTTNPDGTGQMVYFGNQNPGMLMIDAKPIPGTQKVIAVFSPGHGRNEHAGAITIVDVRGGPDNEQMAIKINPDENYRDPYPLSETCFLVARWDSIELMDSQGKTARLYTLPDELSKEGFEVHEPGPLVPRKRELIIPDRSNREETTGRLVLADVYNGRNMEGVERGDIKKLLVVETLPKPINYSGGQWPLTFGGTYNLERILGTVPVDVDGSAYLELPALRSFFFVALDENDMAVKRMQSFLTVVPGETTSCVGCHEQRTHTILPTDNLKALLRPPSEIKPITDCPDVFDHPRDIQPILDRLCVDCHDYDRTERGGPYAGDIILSGDHGPIFSHSYFDMTINGLYSDGRNLPQSNYAPRTLGSSASKILKMIDGSHYGAEATAHEFKMLRLWIESGAPYSGTYAALGCGVIGGYQEDAQVLNVDYDWPETKEAAKSIQRRCAGCHKGDMVLPTALSNENGQSYMGAQTPWMDDPRLKTARHIVFNLSRPEKSLMLLAPLAKEQGGFGICKPADKASRKWEGVFTSTVDQDYQNILAMCTAGKNFLGTIKRFDIPGFQPLPTYLREMKRFGILPKSFDTSSPVNPYDLDQRYWRSLWHTPGDATYNPTKVALNLP